MNSTKTSTGSTRIGLVGLGIMGAPLAQRLLECGYELCVWNLEPERFDLVKKPGAIWKNSPKEVWETSDIVFLCVLGDNAVESVCFGENGFVKAQDGASVLIDLSTTSPGATISMAARLMQETGADWIDAPVSGGPAAARDGSMTLMIGGDEALCAQNMPLLCQIGGNVTRMGSLGAGQMTKILNQAIVGVNYVLMAEVLAIAQETGIDAARLPDCLKGGMADSTILQRVYSQMAAAEFTPPRGRARQLNKDLKSVADFVDQTGLELPVLERAIAQYSAFTNAGNEMADTTEVALWYEDNKKNS